MRLLAAAVCLVVIGATMSACRNGLFGGPNVRRLRLNVARTGTDVVFSANDLFGEIVCSLYDAQGGRGGAPEAIPGNTPAGPRSVRLVWRARCPYGNDCARVVSYGDARLRSDLAPVPLGPSRSGECYLCSVSGDRRRGEVLFSIGADDQIAECPSRKR